MNNIPAKVFATPRWFMVSFRGLIQTFVLATPTAYALVEGGTSALLLLVAAATSFALALNNRDAVERLTREEWALCLALAAPLMVALASEVIHGEIIWRTLDSPSRFFIGIPVFLALRRTEPPTFRYFDWAIACGGIACLLVLVPQFHEWGKMRMESYYMNAIHFGDVALLFAIMTLISVNRKDAAVITALRLTVVGSAFFASFLTGSRGGWIAIPVVGLVYMAVLHRNLSWKLKAALVSGMASILLMIFAVSPFVRGRVDEIYTDLTGYVAGQRDTSVGVRLQLYEAATRGIAQAPMFGLGADGFKRLMPIEIERGAVTRIAGVAGEGEVHNQVLAYGADYGLLGLGVMLSLYLVPSLLFWRAARDPHASELRHKAGLLGLSVTVCFAVFGLTVETFNLKATVSLYVALIAIIAAASTLRDHTDSRTRELCSNT
ncbi:O-antigen ligase family protein [Pandoraea terrigena]|uniref:O-antigen ligase n=1 Tax=Pandoraea terrigena TaxID=2508292 RepID=A0A5E4XBE5_9BURK|nr:O-antigen ligase [Pandoraea terrigena]VVE33535.1 O-antigen ligase [Pandoraea terrigena]